MQSVLLYKAACAAQAKTNFLQAVSHFQALLLVRHVNCRRCWRCQSLMPIAALPHCCRAGTSPTPIHW
jgi:hypothetical protein